METEINDIESPTRMLSLDRRKLAWALLVFLAVAICYLVWQSRRARAEVVPVVTSQRGAVVINRNGDVVSWNKDAERLFGWKGGEVIGMEFAGLMPKHSRDRCRVGIKDAIYSRRHYEVTCHLENKKGWYVPVKVEICELGNEVTWLGLVTVR